MTQSLAGWLLMADPKRYEEFADLIELSSSRILSYLHALLLNWDDAEDAFQETCLVLWQKFDDFTPGTSFLAWALRIAQHKAMNSQRKRKRHSFFSASLRDALMVEFGSRDAGEATASVTALAGCMDKLPQNDQRMVKLCYVEGVPVRRLADAMGRSPDSIHHSLQRIRSWLLDCIRRELNQARAPASFRFGVCKEEDGA